MLKYVYAKFGQSYPKLEQSCAKVRGKLCRSLGKVVVVQAKLCCSMSEVFLLFFFFLQSSL